MRQPIVQTNRAIVVFGEVFATLGLSALSALSGVVVGIIVVLLAGGGLASLGAVAGAVLVGMVAGPVAALAGTHLLVQAVAANTRMRASSALDDAGFYSMLLIGMVVGILAAFTLAAR